MAGFWYTIVNDGGDARESHHEEVCSSFEVLRFRVFEIDKRIYLRGILSSRGLLLGFISMYFVNPPLTSKVKSKQNFTYEDACSYYIGCIRAIYEVCRALFHQSITTEGFKLMGICNPLVVDCCLRWGKCAIFCVKCVPDATSAGAFLSVEILPVGLLCGSSHSAGIKSFICALEFHHFRTILVMSNVGINHAVIGNSVSIVS
jgi:hypothetical protein